MTKSYVLFSRAEAGAADSEAGAAPTVNAAGRVLIASLAGTTIEFFDFYIYATAAVLVFPRLFFPSAQPGTATLQSLATFALAFLARPVGSAVFGHFGDRIGRKATLVAALLTMGLSTVGIGLLPTYAVIGIWAPVLLALLRFGQGFGLGVNGVAPCSWPRKMRPLEGPRSTACFRNWAHPWASCAPPAPFCCWRRC